ncbi:MAG: Rpn family recombination-promoting nuclease/putative transposase, partial [Bacteroidales bacterium]|nr:Rpn family recombination-promoting nuclease/putative transposase [Bacteroidales bacterium]
SVTYLSPELVPENPFKKYSIVDVRCKDKQGRFFIVEMQMEWSSFFMHRMLLNASKVYGTQLSKGEKFNQLQPVYTLAILNENYDHKTKEFYHRYQMTNRQNIDEVIEGIELIFVELQKFKPESLSDRKMAVLWLRFLKEVNEQSGPISKELTEIPEISKAVDICEKGGFSEAEMARYDKYWDSVSIEKTFIDTSFTEGKAKGIAEGRAEGIAEGIAEGLTQIVINSFNTNYSIDTIAKITQLTTEKVTSILKEKGLI